MADFYDFISKKIIEKTQYSGNRTSGSKSISASQLGDDILQIWHRYKHGVPDKKEIGQDTIGTLIHSGIEQILNGEDHYMTEVQYERKFKNGWKLTGTADIVSLEHRLVADIKVTKQYTVEKVLSDTTHSYNLQANAYRYLIEKNHGHPEGTIKPYLLMFLKDGGFDFRKMEDKPSMMLISVPHIPDSDIERLFNSIVEQIVVHELEGTEPFRCEDVWMRKTKDGAVPVRCMKYCAYKHVCKHYNPKPTTVARIW